MEKYKLNYGKSHSKRYKPSVISSVLVERTADGRPVKLHSDVHALIHQKNLEKLLGADVIRSYVDGLARSDYGSIDTSNLSDDELYALIPPKAVNNLTTRYEYAQALKEHEKEIKDNYESYKKASAKQKDLDEFMANLKKRASDQSALDLK